MSRWTILALCGALGGCSDATLSQMRPGIQGSQLTCWLMVDFKSPPAGDPKDVEVQFSSIVLDEDLSFDWAYMTEHDYLERMEQTWQGEVKRFDLDTSTTQDSDPPHGPMLVKFEMTSKKSVTASSYSDVVLDATLYWGGKKQDSIGRGLFTVYQKQ